MNRRPPPPGATLKPYVLPVLLALVYLAICFRFSYGTAGLEEDEAVSFRGSATLADHIEAPCRPGHDFKLGTHCLPVMVAPYVGAPKDYFLLPFFHIFGVHIWVARIGAAILAAIGIFGCWFFMRKFFGPLAAFVAAAFLALNPTYIDAPIFDQGNIAFSLAILGLLLIAIVAVMNRPVPLRFFFLGLAAGLGVWGRLNFAWLIFAAVVAIVVIYRLELTKLVRFLPALAGGFVLGAAPLLAYLVHHGKDIAEFMSTSSIAQTFSQRSTATLRSLRDALLASSEHRLLVWHAPAISKTASGIFICLLALAFVWNLVRKGNVSKVLAIASGVLLLMYLSSSLPVAEHHMVIFVPLAALLLGVSLSDLWKLRIPGQVAVALACCVYLVFVSRVDAESARQLQTSGGYGEWSSSIGSLTEFLEARHPGQRLYALDWGFSDPLYVLSRGDLNAQEIFWSPNEREVSPGRTWSGLIARGGTFVTYAEENLHFPEATIFFQQTLENAGVPFTKTELKQRNGTPYADVFEVAPSTGTLTTGNSPAIAEDTTFRASPAVIKGDANGVGKTSLIFWTKRSHLVEIRLNAPDGTLFARYSSVRSANSGVATTGNWVTNGMTFYLQDVAGKPLTPANTLATVTVQVVK